eukprot:TRINITY_DN6217_c0_g1_i12.p1 TRINITY_DN6217_c0_g1~~TRINITY_DN6217_c0_g1_i12.p1  ORF type:complete len:103 (-),score=12.54 TRINITY_DN6217_c0_g1_i12:656-964(-)
MEIETARFYIFQLLLKLLELKVQQQWSSAANTKSMENLFCRKPSLISILNCVKVGLPIHFPHPKADATNMDIYYSKEKVFHFFLGKKQSHKIAGNSSPSLEN